MWGVRLPGPVALLVIGALLAVGALLSLLYFGSPHATLRLTTGFPGTGWPRVVSAFVSISTRAHPRVRFTLVPVATLEESAKALEEGKVDLAIVRSDASPPVNGQTIAILRHDIAALALPPGSPIKDVAQLSGKTVVIAQGPAQAENSRALDLILSYFNVAPEAVKRVFAPMAEVGDIVARKQAAAAFTVGPIGPGPAVDVVAALARATKGAPTILPVDQAEAIAQRFPGFEAFDIPEGALLAQPQVPGKRVHGLAVSYRFVAPETMLNVVAGAIGKSIFATKTKLMALSPQASSIEAPDLEAKHPILPVHPGVAAYLTHGDQSFFDQLHQYVYIVGIPLSIIGSLIALVVSLIRDRRIAAEQARVRRLLVIAAAARTADAAALERLEEERCAHVAACLGKLAHDLDDMRHVPVSALAIDHARQAIDRRRAELAGAGADGGSGRVVEATGEG